MYVAAWVVEECMLKASRGGGGVTAYTVREGESERGKKYENLNSSRQSVEGHN